MSKTKQVQTKQSTNKAAVAKLFVNILESNNLVTFKIKESYTVKTKFSSTPVTTDIGEYSFSIPHRVPLNLSAVFAKKVKDIMISNLSKRDQVPALIEQFLNRELLKFHKTVVTVYGISSPYLKVANDGDIQTEVLVSPSVFVPAK